MDKAAGTVICSSLCFTSSRNAMKGVPLLSVEYHAGEETEWWKGCVIFPEAQSSEMEPRFPVCLCDQRTSLSKILITQPLGMTRVFMSTDLSWSEQSSVTVHLSSFHRILWGAQIRGNRDVSEELKSSYWLKKKSPLLQCVSYFTQKEKLQYVLLNTCGFCCTLGLG